MPDFFKKMKKKAEKKKMTGGNKTNSTDKPQRRLKFLPLHASTTSLFCRKKRDESAESDGEYFRKSLRYFNPNLTKQFGQIYFTFLFLLSHVLLGFFFSDIYNITANHNA